MSELPEHGQTEAPGASRLTISACLVIHQEAGCLEACLASFAEAVDEIVVVHDGPCSDESLQIARRYTDNVVETQERAGSADLLRPAALARCSGSWVLVIDADERLSPQLKASLRSLAGIPGVDAWSFPWPYVDGEGRRVSRRSRSSKKLLFRRERMYTTGLPHMTPNTYGRSATAPFEVYHLLRRPFGIGTFRDMLRKNRRRGKVAAEKLARGLDAVEFYNASVLDDRVKNVRKLRLLARHPLLALLSIPAWSFVYWYFLRGHVAAGRMGLHDALNLPAYYLYFALNMLRLRLLR